MWVTRLRRWFHLAVLGHELLRTRFLVPLHPDSEAKTAEWCGCGAFWVR
jgi:hypothetical protein